MQQYGEHPLIFQIHQEVTNLLVRLEQLALFSESLSTSVPRLSFGFNGIISAEDLALQFAACTSTLPNNGFELGRLLSNLIRIIEIQADLLEKRRQKGIHLKEFNQELFQEIGRLQRSGRGRCRDSEDSRCSSPDSSIGTVRKSPRVRYTYILRRRLSSVAIPKVRPIPKNGKLESNQPLESKTGSDTVRKTRSTASARDLVPFSDFISKRRSRRSERNSERSSSESSGLIKSAGDEFEPAQINQTNNISVGERNFKQLPKHRIQMHLEGNYVSTLHPDFSRPSPAFETDSIHGMNDGILQVPGWRLKKIDPCRKGGAGPEDIDDEVYLRRHLKAEDEEKRRKRWDAQKQRENEYLDQLKDRLAQRAERRRRLNKGRGRVSEDGWDDLAWIEPFHPKPQDALFLQVDPQIPINVFGRPLPAFEPSDFTLPWTHF